MKVAVCVKQVPDTASLIKPTADGTAIETFGLNYVVNPYDEYAIEEALRIKQKFPGSDVTALSVGPERVKEALRTALAMGADQAVHVVLDQQQPGNPLDMARTLAAALKSLGSFDVILCGRQAVDVDEWGVGPMIAELLGLPSLSVVKKLDVTEGRATAETESEGALRVVETTLPCVVTAQKGLNEPRYASLPGLMAAKKKEIKVMTLGELGATESDASAPSRMRYVKFEAPSARGQAKILKGDPAEIVPQIVKMIRDETKVI